MRRTQPRSAHSARRYPESWIISRSKGHAVALRGLNSASPRCGRVPLRSPGGCSQWVRLWSKNEARRDLADDSSSSLCALDNLF
jgi:hypothetical protein